MRYLTTLEVARQIGVSKQTLLNWLYAQKVPEPPRNRKGYRLWSPSRVALVQKLIGEGHLHRRTIVHTAPRTGPDALVVLVREVAQFLRDAQIDPPAFLRELARQSPTLAPFVRQRARRQRVKRRAGTSRPTSSSGNRR